MSAVVATDTHTVGLQLRSIGLGTQHRGSREEYVSCCPLKKQDTALYQCTRTLIQTYQLLEHILELSRIEVRAIGHSHDRMQPVQDVSIAGPDTTSPTLGKSESVDILTLSLKFWHARPA